MIEQTMRKTQKSYRKVDWTESEKGKVANYILDESGDPALIEDIDIYRMMIQAQRKMLPPDRHRPIRSKEHGHYFRKVLNRYWENRMNPPEPSLPEGKLQSIDDSLMLMVEAVEESNRSIAKLENRIERVESEVAGLVDQMLGTLSQIETFLSKLVPTSIPSPAPPPAKPARYRPKVVITGLKGKQFEDVRRSIASISDVNFIETPKFEPRRINDDVDLIFGMDKSVSAKTKALSKEILGKRYIVVNGLSEIVDRVRSASV